MIGKLIREIPWHVVLFPRNWNSFLKNFLFKRLQKIIIILQLMMSDIYKLKNMQPENFGEIIGNILYEADKPLSIDFLLGKSGAPESEALTILNFFRNKGIVTFDDGYSNIQITDKGHSSTSVDDQFLGTIQ